MKIFERIWLVVGLKIWNVKELNTCCIVYNKSWNTKKITIYSIKIFKMDSDESSEKVAVKPPAPIPGSKKRKPMTTEQKV